MCCRFRSYRHWLRRDRSKCQNLSHHLVVSRISERDRAYPRDIPLAPAFNSAYSLAIGEYPRTFESWVFQQRGMPGKLLSWPDWPEFTPGNAETGDDLVGFKKGIVDKYGKDNIIKSWLKVCKELETVTDRIAEQGTSIIPEVQFEELFALTTERKQSLKDVGCFVVRDVFSREQADEWFKILKQYVAANRASIAGMSRPPHFSDIADAGFC